MKKFPARLKVPDFKRSLKKFPGNNIQIISGPDLRQILPTSTPASRSFSVTPTLSGVFEVREITVMLTTTLSLSSGGPDSRVTNPGKHKDHPADTVRQLH